ncbi:neutral zinc metallopeptidase [Saccharopolyspora sp. WRP15-2]|uniref:Neutral zinc metallopeptidase n=1 Tax=Saccharopolyspora oryzae TaxID=2997343 RepID=A0ABT4VB22_9PSEU|nr:neutral zinc metallopeptidase [Saccharopolyspora oryzae]MDA3630497.1 neutral zinc metallopeptidase [Saccharopolyspora oryzae]
MRFNENAELDTSQVQEAGGSGGGFGGGAIAVGGGGLTVVGVVIFFLISNFLGGGQTPLPLSLDQLPAGQQADDQRLAQECRTGADANRRDDCALVASINSIQGYWNDQFKRSGGRYRTAPTNFFRGSVQTACGGATSDVGPFYCPADSEVYIDLDFFKDLQTRFGARGGQFVEAYVLAHEYGHHVQNLLGTSSKVDPRKTGPTSGAVRLELQADCYAGVWANHATTVPTKSGQPLIEDITQDDVNRALDAAEHIGDDFIQAELGGGRVDESKFSHGSSAQREKWFTTGLRSGNPNTCNTFDPKVSLG